MKDSVKNEVAGNAHEVKGSVKQAVGHVTGNPKVEADGQQEKIAGKVQKKIGQVERVIDK
jgi:uncharacterized protein YjbJ (UPF0337 family)